MRTLLITLAFCLPLLGIGQTVQISGSSSQEYANKPFVLYEVTDAISGRKKPIAEGVTDMDGAFAMTANLAQTTTAVLSIDRVEATLFLAPNSTYNLAFPSLPGDAPKSFGAANSVDLGFYNLPENDPNSIVTQFNDALEQLSLENLDLAFTPQYSKKLLSFWREYRDAYPANTFAGNYIHFACANALLNNGLKKTKVYEYFLDSATVISKNPEVGVFFTEFFQDILQETDRLSGTEEVKITINLAPRAYKILESLKSNDYLSDLKLREMVALYGLYHAFDYKEYNQENIIELVRELGARSIYPEIRSIADNVAYMMRWLRPGFPLPSFSCTGLESGEEVKSDGFSNKPTIYYFWAPWSERAVMELMELKQRQQYWKDDLNYVVVLVDGTLADAKSALELVPGLQAEMCHATSNPKLLDKLQIHALPHFMMTDEEGKLVRHYASNTTELERELARFFKTKKKR